MADELSDVIAAVEGEFPGLKWLMRSMDAGETLGLETAPGGNYFAHIYDPDLNWDSSGRSHMGTGETPVEALREALEDAREYLLAA